MPKKGAYVLYLEVPNPLTLPVGALKACFLPAGRYAYVGSAKSGIEGRISRHRRLAATKTGKRRWHIDYLLVHPEVRLVEAKTFAGDSECRISRGLASRKGVTAPVPRFGSTDCRAGCKAHLYIIRRSRRADRGFTA